MKPVNKFSLTVILALFAVSAFGQPKFGHMNSSIVLSQMPEYIQAANAVAKMDTTLQETLEKMQVEFNNKVNDFQTDTISPEMVMQVKYQEIMEMQPRIEQFQQNIPMSLQMEQRRLLGPIQQKLMQQVNSIAEEKGLVYVFDLASGNPIYTSEESEDITVAVLAAMGIEFDPASLQQGAGMQ